MQEMESCVPAGSVRVYRGADFEQPEPATACHPPQRERKPRQPPAWRGGGLICSANSSLTGSSSIPGSSGARIIMGITGGMSCGELLGMSRRARNNGAAGAGGGALRGGGGGAPGGGGGG